MFELPPLPGWDGFHPLIVHFPIALLFIVPLFIVLGLLRSGWRGGMMTSALVLMALGTLALWVAVPTGEAAGKLAERLPGVGAVLERHESLAETTRTFFTVLTVIFAVILAGLRYLRREKEVAPALALHLPFLALYLAGILVLANTAHNGGRLVHEFGVTALVPNGGATGAPVARTPVVASPDAAGDKRVGEDD